MVAFIVERVKDMMNKIYYIPIFLLILITGLAYVWQKSDLDWVKRKIAFASGRYENQKLEGDN